MDSEIGDDGSQGDHAGAAATVETLVQNAGLNEVVAYSTSDMVADAVRSANDETLIVVGVGVKWLYPSHMSLQHMATLQRALEKQPTVDFMLTKWLLLDGDKERTFCHSNRIIVGQTALAAWFCGRRLSFERAEWPASHVVIGTLNDAMLRTFLKSIIDALRSNKDSSASVSSIQIPF